MRSVDLAVYADTIAAEAAALAARLERARRRLRQASIEHEARRALPEETVRTLEKLGVLSRPADPAAADEIAEAHAALTAVRRLQAWIEAELHAARGRDQPPDAAVSAMGACARTALGDPPAEGRRGEVEAMAER